MLSIQIFHNFSEPIESGDRGKSYKNCSPLIIILSVAFILVLRAGFKDCTNYGLDRRNQIQLRKINLFAVSLNAN